MGVTVFNVASGGVTIEDVHFLNGVIDLDGKDNGLKLDADGDTSIGGPSDDVIQFTIGGAKDFNMSSKAFNLATGSKILGPSGVSTGTFIPLAAQQNLSGAGAISEILYYTTWTTTGANAATLADGGTIGQLKLIQMIVDAGTGTLTPTNLDGGTTITFDDVGDTALLGWDGTNWVALALYNIVDGATAPVLA